jgi:DNA polymerase III alpha subunit
LLFNNAFTKVGSAAKEFKKFADKHEDIINIATSLQGLIRHTGIHASAWIITADPINDFFPLQLNASITYADPKYFTIN